MLSQTQHQLVLQEEMAVRDQLTAMGLTVGYMTPQQLATRQADYTKAWTRITEQLTDDAQQLIACALDLAQVVLLDRVQTRML